MYILQESTHFTHFVAIYAYFYVTLGGSAQIITILHRGGSARFITILHGGGSGQFITILHGGGSSETPKLYYVIYEQPLMVVYFSTNAALQPERILKAFAPQLMFPTMIPSLEDRRSAWIWWELRICCIGHCIKSSIFFWSLSILKQRCVHLL